MKSHEHPALYMLKNKLEAVESSAGIMDDDLVSYEWLMKTIGKLNAIWFSISIAEAIM